MDSLDSNYSEDATMFMGVLNELSKAVVRWYPDGSTEGQKGKDDISDENASVKKTNTATDGHCETDSALRVCVNCGGSVDCASEVSDNLRAERNKINDVSNGNTEINCCEDGTGTCIKCGGVQMLSESQESGTGCVCNKSTGSGVQTMVEVSSIEYADEENEIEVGQFEDADVSGGKTRVVKSKVMTNGPVSCAQCLKTLPNKLCERCSVLELEECEVSTSVEKKTKRDKIMERELKEKTEAQMLCKMCLTKLKSANHGLPGSGRNLKLTNQNEAGSDVTEDSKLTNQNRMKLHLTKKTAEDVRQYFANILQLEKEAIGEISEEDLENFK